jgi:hypothetical protein
MTSSAIRKRLLPLLCLCAIQVTGWAADTKPLHKVDSPDLRVAIQLHVEEGIDVGGGKPGFRLALSGWPPGAAFDVYALDADGTRVSLVDGALVDTTGAATVAVPYESEGLHPGPWIIGVASKDLVRGEKLLIPRVIHDKRGWRLDFKSPQATRGPA